MVPNCLMFLKGKQTGKPLRHFGGLPRERHTRIYVLRSADKLPPGSPSVSFLPLGFVIVSTSSTCHQVYIYIYIQPFVLVFPPPFGSRHGFALRCFASSLAFFPMSFPSRHDTIRNETTGARCTASSRRCCCWTCCWWWCP